MTNAMRRYSIMVSYFCSLAVNKIKLNKRALDNNHAISLCYIYVNIYEKHLKETSGISLYHVKHVMLHNVL